MGSWSEIKVRGTFAPEEGDQRSMAIWKVRWRGTGFELRADPRCAEEFARRMGITKEPKGLDIQWMEQLCDEDAGGEEMNAVDAECYRVWVARANYSV